MSNRFSFLAILFIFCVFLIPSVALAHQPRLVDSNQIEVKKPEESKAYYGELKGIPNEFRIQSSQDFCLYVGLLVPDILGVRKDISAEIYQVTSGGNQQIAFLDGQKFDWTPFFEEFARDNYFWGPEFKADDSKKGVELKGRKVPAGVYVIKVFSPSNQGKYSLAIGDAEVFPLLEIVNATITVPRVKAQFFNYSPWKVLVSPYGWGYILALYILAFIFGFMYRAVLRKYGQSNKFTVKKNIGTKDRWVRAGLGLLFLLWAINTTWSPIFLFASGFCIFEAIFSWCGLYAVLGKNSCPL